MFAVTEEGPGSSTRGSRPKAPLTCLHRFGSVAPDGQYHSPIKNKSARFNAMLAALTPSRLAVTFQAMGLMKLGLMIAIRCSHSWRQFAPEAKEEVEIIAHGTQTPRLMPHLATAWALTFASRDEHLDCCQTFSYSE
ncbi:acyl-coenzyme A oxidase-like protein isoform X1 [Manis javanica]|uniref:acyl-coenzyme A oxidase-like protein isoform X1 n=1 Tax=Manis javanica TaxID=9974 RepID=UPI003C6D39F0